MPFLVKRGNPSCSLLLRHRIDTRRTFLAAQHYFGYQRKKSLFFLYIFVSILLSVHVSFGVLFLVSAFGETRAWFWGAVWYLSETGKFCTRMQSSFLFKCKTGHFQKGKKNNVCAVFWTLPKAPCIAKLLFLSSVHLIHIKGSQSVLRWLLLSSEGLTRCQGRGAQSLLLWPAVFLSFTSMVALPALCAETITIILALLVVLGLSLFI